MTKKIAAFCHIEKTGGTTLIQLLRANMPFSHCDLIPLDATADLVGEADIRRANLVYPKLRSIAGHSLRPFVDHGAYQDRLEFYTVLRPGVARTVSDFNHDYTRRGFDGTLEEWLQYEDRWNFQTKALAGDANLSAAKDVLAERFAFAYPLSDYDTFVEHVRLLMRPSVLRGEYKVANRVGERQGYAAAKTPPIRKPLPPTEAALRQAAELNSIDQQLHDFVAESLVPAQKAALEREGGEVGSLRGEKVRRALSGFYRNLAYKSAVGHRPFSNHALPRNAVNSEEYHRARQKG